jgi:hypothetical protein
VHYRDRCDGALVLARLDVVADLEGSGEHDYETACHIGEVLLDGQRNSQTCGGYHGDYRGHRNAQLCQRHDYYYYIQQNADYREQKRMGCGLKVALFQRLSDNLYQQLAYQQAKNKYRRRCQQCRPEVLKQI